jgi:hypothetical protein
MQAYGGYCMGGNHDASIGTARRENRYALGRREGEVVCFRIDSKDRRFADGPFCSLQRYD